MSDSFSLPSEDLLDDMLDEVDSAGSDEFINPPPRPAFVTGWLIAGGAQILTLRLAAQMPRWIKERTEVWIPHQEKWDDGLARSAAALQLTRSRPLDATHWILSCTDVKGMHFPQSKTTVLLHGSVPDEHRMLYEGLRPTGVFGVSQAVLAANERWIKNNGHTVCGVLPPVYTKTEEEWIDGDRHSRALFIGRAVEAKGFNLLPELLQRMPWLHIKAYVFGPRENTFTSTMERAETLGVKSRLYIADPVYTVMNYHEMYRNADVLLLLSKTEGQPLVVGEALSCGVPVVATAVGGIPEIIEDGVNGFLLPSATTGGLNLDDIEIAIQKAMRLDRDEVMDSAHDILKPAWRRNHLPKLLRRIGGDLSGSRNPRTTIAVMCREAPRVDRLDECMASIAGQIDRSFRIVVVGLGDWRPVAARYGVASVEAYGLNGLSELLKVTSTEFTVCLTSNMRLTAGYLKHTIAMMEATGFNALTAESGWAPSEESEQNLGVQDPVTCYRTSVCRSGAGSTRIQPARILVVGR